MMNDNRIRRSLDATHLEVHGALMVQSFFKKKGRNI